MGKEANPDGPRTTRWPEDGFPFDLRSLRYILTAAEQMSFSGAAKVLNLRASSISRRVRDFEDQIGVALFERTPSGVRLTNAGSHFLTEVVPALRRVEAALHNAGAAGRAQRGIVRVGILTTLGGGLLRDVIVSFRREYKDVAVVVYDGGRSEHLRAIRTRDVDVAFITGNTPLSDCEVFELWRERVYVAMGASHPLVRSAALDWHQLRDQEFIVAMHDPGPEVHDYIIRRVADYGTYPTVLRCPAHQETLMHLVAMGTQITLVSEGWTKVGIPDVVFRPLISPEDIVPFSAVWSPSNDNPALRRFISFSKLFVSKVSKDDLKL
ncbi:LysR family transcriptional regulator [Methylobacterium aquaticum]|uniref:LysR family transcriptional regulator n=1 Tax=Methylobacterium aquaticum TaxID=270351 RepID=UPI003D177284